MIFVYFIIESTLYASTDVLLLLLPIMIILYVAIDDSVIVVVTAAALYFSFQSIFRHFVDGFFVLFLTFFATKCVRLKQIEVVHCA